MLDYSNLGLNAQLNSNDSLAAKEDKFVSGNEFDATMDRGVITATRLGSAAVGSANLATGAVHSAVLADAAVITSKFGTASVTSDILANLAVTAGKIASNVVAGTHITGTAIAGTHIQNAAIGTAQIGVAAIGAAAIQNLAVGSAAIGTAAIQAVHLGTAIITDANVGTMTFNTISGGTANLGGTLSGNGVLQVSQQNGDRYFLANAGSVSFYGDSSTTRAETKFDPTENAWYTRVLNVGGTWGGTPAQDGWMTVYSNAHTPVVDINSDEGVVVQQGRYVEIGGTSATTGGTANTVRMYVDSSGGKNRLMAIFGTGVAQVVATQP